jgi:hypothetical protein
VIVSDELRDPVAVGLKLTAKVQVLLAVKVEPQVPPAMVKSPGFVPPNTPLNEIGPVWLLVTVTFLVVLVPPTAIEPKVRLVAEIVTGATPVPLRLALCGLLAALSLTVNVAAREPIADGPKVTEIVQESLAGKLAPQVLV